MILFKYLSKQVYQLLVGIAITLTIVALFSRFIQYLSQAAIGELSSDILFWIVLYRMPDFLLIILPLSLFLAVLITYSRLYAENEMVVLFNSGLSESTLLAYTQLIAALILLSVAILSFQLAPWGLRNTETLLLQQGELTEVDLITAGRFQTFNRGHRVTYADRVIQNSSGQRELQNVFVAAPVSTSAVGSRIIIADRAKSLISGRDRYLELENVRQIEGEPGQSDFSISHFEKQIFLLPESEEVEQIDGEATLPMFQLFGSSEPRLIAELQWRLSLVLLIPVLVTLAVPLSRVRPRQGQYSKLFVAILLFSSYILLLQICRDAISRGSLIPWLGVWWVHALFLLLGLGMLTFPNVGDWFSLGKTND
ncbi:LPS export ABC transporter permease LptF [Gammaproteobacteria bacterium]|nr:LPS export ABC transporter permease LptF [Gammaproteobacteria bacterium]MDB2444312.1 LPS export ABC transporter permease LptF [Gammaproteobacteria bacterium]